MNIDLSRRIANSSQRGISVVEVMVSMVILMAILTGVSTVFANSSRMVNQSDLMTQANDLAQRLLEKAFICKFEDSTTSYAPSDIDKNIPTGGTLDSQLKIVVTPDQTAGLNPRPYHVKVYQMRGGVKQQLLGVYSTLISVDQTQECS